MKKIISVILCLAVLLSFAACTKKPAGNEKVKITLPLAMLSQDDIDNPASYLERNNFLDCEIDENEKTVTVTMLSSTHKFLLADIGMSVMKNITEGFSSPQFPYFKNIADYNDNFSEITLLVDGAAYKEDDQKTLLPFYVGECCLFYQYYTEENIYNCKITIKDEKSGEIIDARNYKQDNSGKETTEEN